MTVESLIRSYPSKPETGKVIPCNNNTAYVRLRHLQVREYLAIYILYEYTKKKVFLPSTVLSYCAIPNETLGAEYENILLPFLEQMSTDRAYFFSGKLYKHYASEMKTLFEDLHEGGNYGLSREICLKLWVQYRTVFRDEPFCTTAVVNANPVLCKKYNITYAGPLIF